MSAADDGDHSKSVFNAPSTPQKNSTRTLSIQSAKRRKTPSTINDNSLLAQTIVDPDVHLAEEFFLHSHPFSDLTLLIQGQILYVDKSILTVGSKIFRSYFDDENIQSIEILDVSPNEMIELLQFIYPQFQCTIHNQNVTVLLILAHRFEFHLISDACRAFILLYLSKLQCVSISPNGSQLIEQEDGSRVPFSTILGILCTWFREFVFVNDNQAGEALLGILAQCTISNFLHLDGFDNLESNIRCKLFQARAKYLENECASNIGVK